MNAASTAPTAPVVCPIVIVSRRSQATSYSSAAAPDSRYRTTKRREPTGNMLWYGAFRQRGESDEEACCDVRGGCEPRHCRRCAGAGRGDAALGVRICRPAAGRFGLLEEMHRRASSGLRARWHADGRWPEADAAWRCRAWTVTEIANDYGPVDWYPGDHPKMPEIVAHGDQAPRHPCVRALSFPERHGQAGERAGIRHVGSVLHEPDGRLQERLAPHDRQEQGECVGDAADGGGDDT